MAAIAVLAIAFVVLAAIPVIADDSEGAPVTPATMQTVEKYSPEVKNQYVTDRTVSGNWEIAGGEEVTITGWSRADYCRHCQRRDPGNPRCQGKRQGYAERREGLRVR